MNLDFAVKGESSDNMVFQRIYHEGLAQASYLIGCSKTGLAVVIDPNRAISRYIDEATRLGLSIAAVTETHIHADYLSGSRELAAKTKARLFLSDEGTEAWRYQFIDSDGAFRLKHGAALEVGSLRLEAIRTPGHTPEHLCFLLTDLSAGDMPCALITGDFVFCGDVGRPDLLETAAGIKGSMESSASELYASLASTSHLSGDLLIWPGHGAGSACGKAMSAVPVSTLGYERKTNWAFLKVSEADFISEVLAGQPDPPAYFAKMKELNRLGPPILGERPALRRVTLAEVQGVGRSQVVDLRSFDDFCSGHLEGSITLPRYRNFITYAGSVLDYERTIWFVASDSDMAEEARNDLALIGLDDVEGYVLAQDLLLAPITQMKSATAREVIQGSERFELVDVRNRNEWSLGHLPDALHIPYPSFASRLNELPRDKPIAVFCQSGARSETAASLLQAHGFQQVVSVTDGFKALERELESASSLLPIH